MAPGKKYATGRIILIIVGSLLLVGAGVVWYLFSRTHKDTADTRTEIRTDAQSLIAAFKSNLEEANLKYAEKIMEVSGRVSEIEKADTVYNIKMSDPAGAYIIFSFQQDDAQEVERLKPGDSIQVKGSCSGGAYSSILQTVYIAFNRCIIEHIY